MHNYSSVFVARRSYRNAANAEEHEAILIRGYVNFFRSLSRWPPVPVMGRYSRCAGTFVYFVSAFYFFFVCIIYRVIDGSNMQSNFGRHYQTKNYLTFIWLRYYLYHLISIRLYCVREQLCRGI